MISCWHNDTAECHIPLENKSGNMKKGIKFFKTWANYTTVLQLSPTLLCFSVVGSKLNSWLLEEVMDEKESHFSHQKSMLQEMEMKAKGRLSLKQVIHLSTFKRMDTQMLTQATDDNCTDEIYWEWKYMYDHVTN